MIRQYFLIATGVMVGWMPLIAAGDSLPSYLDQASSSDIAGATSVLPVLGVAIEPFQPNGISYPGLVQRIWHSNFENFQGIDVRTIPRASIYVPEGEPVTPFLPVGPFGFELEGMLFFESEGNYRFRAEGRGKAWVEAHGEKVFESTGNDLSQGKSYPFLFEQGHHPLKIRYESPEEGDAVFRLLWSSDAFAEEPVSSRFLSHDFIAEDLKRASRLRLGRDSFAKYRCLHCHEWENLDPEIRMWEIDRDAPSFEGIGARYRSDWLVRQILSPHSTRPEAEMPAMAHSSGSENATEAARLMASYLATLSNSQDLNVSIDLDDPVLTAHGKTLFEEQDCIACHIDPTGEIDAASGEDRIPLRGLGDKWKIPALVEFLQDPDRYYRWIQMPDYGFDQDDALALVAYLIETDTGTLEPSITESIQGGKELIEENLCLRCHSLTLEPQGPRPSHLPPPMAQTSLREGGEDISPLRSTGNGLEGEIGLVATAGCLSATAAGRGAAPDFPFEEAEREAIQLFLAEGLDSLNRPVAAEFAQRQVESLRCNSCHGEEVEETVKVGWESFVSLSSLLSSKNDPPTEATSENTTWVDEEEDWADIPQGATQSEHQIRPTLVWAGEKLRTDWIKKLFEGDLPRKTRSLLPARMPAFRSIADPMATGLAHSHGLSTDLSAIPSPDALLAKIGEKILLDPPGLNCIACHPLGDRPAGSGVQGSAIPLELAPGRLRRPFFERLLANPQRVLPGTPMPQFIDAEGKTAALTFLEGDGTRQREAIWNALISLHRESAE